MSDFYVNLGGVLHNFSEHKVMSILNITPDSFYKGSRVFCLDRMVEKIELDIKYGADIFDIGGYSSRPNSEDVSVDEEVRRVCGAVERVRDEFPDLVLSIDTFRSKVVEEVVKNFGAVIVNDISAGELDSRILDVTAKFGLPYIAMHMRGLPQTMQTMCDYNDVVNDVVSYFIKRCEMLRNKGVEQIIIDPGFGFAKNVEQNFEMLRRFDEFKVLGLPLLGGVSRKSMIYKTLECEPCDALNGTTALNWQLLSMGANIIRVHDVKEANETVRLFNAMLNR